MDKRAYPNGFCYSEVPLYLNEDELEEKSDGED